MRHPDEIQKEINFLLVGCMVCLVLFIISLAIKERIAPFILLISIIIVVGIFNKNNELRTTINYNLLQDRLKFIETLIKDKKRKN